ncbi:MAG: hypothetical protein INR62_02915 [Rhodospirillales bacterium]|nr:hypothetical protein [Acetobacter sp.]
MANNPRQARTVAILGAGCAGTLLAAELRRRRFSGRVELLDARTDFVREQRWCFWRDGRETVPDLPISAEWLGWQVADQRQSICHAAPSCVYSHVHAHEFFGRFHARLADDPQVGVRLGCRVLSVERRSGRTFRVQTSGGELLADAVIDARHEGAPSYERTIANVPGLLWQTFRGRVVEFAIPCLNPATVTFMDFRVSMAGAGLAFVYVLPFTKTRALVEAVVLDCARADAPRLDAILEAYSEERFGGGGEILAVEEGVLPMTSRSFMSRGTNHSLCLGVGGGAARPSSGYAFANILRAVRRTAGALCAGQPQWQPRFAWKYRVLDALFLRLLRTDPAGARHAFMAMFAGVEPARLVRFLTEASSLRDDLAVGFALPKAAFCKTVFLPRAGVIHSDRRFIPVIPHLLRRS